MPPTLEELIPAFRRAVHDELNSKRHGPPCSLPLTDGHPDGRHGCQHRFLFRTPSLCNPSVLDDGQGELHVNGERHPCAILSINVDRVLLALAQELGPHIPRARLTIDRVRLLEGLLKRLTEIETNPHTFLTSLALKCFDPTAAPTLIQDHEFTAETPLNTAQQAALLRALSQDFLFIWGPPGTGKTTVIGSLVHAALERRQRILMCATTNAAVDQALDAVLHQGPIADLIRYGIPSADASPDVAAHALDTIAMAHTRPLEAQLELCTQTLTPLEEDAAQLEQVLALHDHITDTQSDLRDAEDQIRHMTLRLATAHVTLHASRAHVQALAGETRSIARAGFLRRWFLRSATQVQTELRQSRDTLKVQQQQAQFLDAELQQRSTRYVTLSQRLVDLNNRLGAAPMITAAEASNRLRILDPQIQSLRSRRTHYRKAITDVKAALLRNSRVVATTLTRLYTTPILEEQRFDLVILDEASMASLPALFAVLCVARQQVVLVGDFFQLPPIAESTSPAAQEWLARDIYTVAGVHHSDDHRVAALDTQYRMHADIARIAQRLYRRAGLTYRTAPEIRTAREGVARVGPAPGKGLVFVDTAGAHPGTECDSKGSAGNRYHAQVAIHVAQLALTNSPELTVGIIAPYRHQIRLLRQLAHDRALDTKVRIGTIHQFQGQESDVIIFDTTVTGDLTRTMLGRSDGALSPWKLVNVGLTRAKGKLIIIGHRAALAMLSHLPKALLWDCVHLSEELGGIIPATELVPTA